MTTNAPPLKSLFSTLSPSEAVEKEREEAERELVHVSKTSAGITKLRLDESVKPKQESPQETIELPLSKCDDCPFNCNDSLRSSYRGPIPAKILVLGEAPTAVEARRGEAMRGRPGKLISSIIEEVGLDPEDVFYTNVVLCSRGKQDKIKKPEMEACRENIEALIEAVKPEVIVPLGVPAMKLLTGKASGITKVHGTKIQSPYGLVVPTMNPGYALKKGASVSPKTEEDRMAGIRGEIVSDFEYIRMILTGTEPDHRADKDYRLITTFEDLEWVVDEISKVDEIALDLETTGLLFFRDRVVGVAISWAEKQGVYIPMRLKNSDMREYAKKDGHEHMAEYLKYYDALRERMHLPAADAPMPRKKAGKKKELKLGERMIRNWGHYHDDVYRILKKVFTRPGLKIYGWNFKFDHRFLMQEGKMPVFPVAGDGMFMSYLLDENSPNDLKSNAYKNFRDLKGYADELREHVSQSNIDDEALANAPIEVLLWYAAGDTDATLRLCRLYRSKLQEEYPDLWRYHEEFYMPLHHIYAEAEFEGARVDPEWVRKAKAQLIREREEIGRELFEILEEPYDNESKLLSSPQQLVKKVFGPESVLKVPEPPPEGKKKRYTTSTDAPSTNEVTIKELIFHKYRPGTKQNTFARRILEYKDRSKQLSTYINGCTSELDGYGRVHWNTNLIGAVTGRLSAKRIPIQTIPRKPLMRGIFIPWDGWHLIEFDYSQLELRVAAWYSRDPVMCAEFENGEDSHKNTAMAMFNKTVDEVTKEERKLAKSTNFGSLYEGGPATLADSINSRRDLEESLISAEETAVFQDAWRRRYRGFVKWRKKIHKTVMISKKVVSPLGRVRRLPNVDSEEEGDRAEALREGPNSLIQGLGSDLAEFALVRIYKRLREGKFRARFRWSLHDALFFEAPREEVLEVCRIIKEEMQRPDERCPGLNTPAEFKVFKDRWAGEDWEEDLEDPEGSWGKLEEAFAGVEPAPNPPKVFQRK